MAHYLIINTGGTIGMVDSEHGLTPKPGELQRAFENIPALSPWQAHDLTWVNHDPLLDSSDLTPQHWYDIKNTILEHSTIDGVLVVHGTDTLAYTSAALSYLTAGLSIPIVVMGSMKPIWAKNTDGIDNLLLALKGLEQAKQEVIVAVGPTLLPGTRVTKSSTRANAGFTTPGWRGDLTTPIQANHTLNTGTAWKPSAIGVITLFPGVSVDFLLAMIESDYRAIVINAYGNGNAMNESALVRILHKAKQRGIPVFIRSQCVEGDVSFGLYAASETFENAGAIGCGSMPLEAVVTKLQILCAIYKDNADVITNFLKPIAREWE